MHIEKNVCDNLLATLMNVDGCKDDEYSRIYLETKNMKQHFWLQRNDQGEVIMPIAPYYMSSKARELFLKVLNDLRFPDGYGSNLSRCVQLKKRKLINLKSHDNHIIMQDIFPIALKASSDSKVVDLIDDLSSFFKSLCANEIDPDHLDALQSKIVEVLYRMEIEFLPAFFTIMVHLSIHLVKEVKLGLVYYRWMYPIERYLAHLKTFVRNRSQPEGSIAENYIIEETITFCSRYLEGVETIFNRKCRNDGDDEEENYLVICSVHVGEQLGREFLSQKRRENPRINATDDVVNKWKLEEFPDWMKLQVPKIDATNPEGRMLSALASGPTSYAKRMKGRVINGFKFNTISRERGRKTQNSGVMVES